MSVNYLRSLSFALLLALISPTQHVNAANGKDIRTCTVFGVSDGDTIRVRCGEGEQQRVRLAEIDAPESKQPFGQRSKQRLSDLVYRKDVQMEVIDTDRYGRLVARIHLDGTNINFKMVEDGLAWCYTRYVRDRRCFAIEREAKQASRGLWADKEPVAPWEWRRK